MENKTKTYCISDIHGEYDLFMRLLERIKYSDSDRLIVCGDFIDKGGNSIRLAKTIFDLPHSQCIMGNHEYMFFKTYCAMTSSDMQDFDVVFQKLQQYFPDDGHLLDWDVVDRLLELPYYVEEKEFVCVHAGIPLDNRGRLCPLTEVLREEFVYDRRFKEPNVLPKESKCVFFGHTPTTYLGFAPKILTYPRYENKPDSRHISDYYKIQLDTGASKTGVLGCFCVDDCQSVYVTR